MARYSGFFVVSVSLENIRKILIEILEDAQLKIIYDRGKSIMAQEVTGKVPMSQLVTVEFGIKNEVDDDAEIKLNFVLTNNELPLHENNHCHEVFDALSTLIMNFPEWQVLDAMLI
ncbi:MAG: hypothetical protein ACRCT1_18260 [Microcoleaceae cyanobacterium]|jgi:hypothetical protein